MTTLPPGALPIERSAVRPRLLDPQSIIRFGLLALSTDLTSEGDLGILLGSSRTAIHVSRVPFANPTTPDSLAAMLPHLAAATALLVPGVRLAAIAYSCTAASVVIGDAVVEHTVRSIRPGIPVVTPAKAVRVACRALRVKRIAVVTPYNLATSTTMAGYFIRHGIEIVGLQYLGLDDDRQMARIAGQTIIEAALAADSPDAEALFFSCTALPALPVIAEIERMAGKPVITSNQASGWAMARLGGLESDRPRGYGSLLDVELTTEQWESEV